MQEAFFLVDSDALITAHRRLYWVDICPGFWNNLLEYREKERIFSIVHIPTKWATTSIAFTGSLRS